MISKYLLLAFSSLGSVGFKGTSETASGNITIKLVCTLIISTMLVFSIVELGLLYQQWLSQFKNATLFEVLSFGFVAIFGPISIYLLFQPRGSKNSSLKNKVASSTPLNIGIPGLALSFGSGLVQGFATRHQNQNVFELEAVKSSH